ncbi:MAG: porin [Succinivibrio sp.]
MKKSILALAVVTAASSATAATVYDKDGTSLTIGGRVQSVVYNGPADTAEIAHKDAGLVNSARFSIEGSAKINDSVSGIGYTEWDMADGNKAATGDSISTREQYVGADFGSYGKLLLGKTYDAANEVLAATDIFEDFGARLQGDINGDRRTGMFRYIYDDNGIFASLSYQTASDDTPVEGEEVNVKGGFAASLGYTFENVLFGPLAFKVGYSYVKGQDDFNTHVLWDNDPDNTDSGLDLVSKAFDSYRSTALSASWGSTDAGFYLGALLNSRESKTRFFTDFTDQSYFKDKSKGFELVAGYTFENGLGVFTGYNLADCKEKLDVIGAKETYIYRRVPVYVNFAFNENFNVWGEAEFDADSTSPKDGEYETGTMLSAGARYTF